MKRTQEIDFAIVSSDFRPSILWRLPVDSVKPVPEKWSLVKGHIILNTSDSGLPLIIVSSPLEIWKFLRMRAGG